MCWPIVYSKKNKQIDILNEMTKLLLRREKEKRQWETPQRDQDLRDQVERDMKRTLNM